MRSVDQNDTAAVKVGYGSFQLQLSGLEEPRKPPTALPILHLLGNIVENIVV
jgi:hypothetical protein